MAWCKATIAQPSSALMLLVEIRQILRPAKRPLFAAKITGRKAIRLSSSALTLGAIRLIVPRQRSDGSYSSCPSGKYTVRQNGKRLFNIIHGHRPPMELILLPIPPPPSASPEKLAPPILFCGPIPIFSLQVHFDTGRAASCRDIRMSHRPRCQLLGVHPFSQSAHIQVTQLHFLHIQDAFTLASRCVHGNGSHTICFVRPCELPHLPYSDFTSHHATIHSSI
ncbi:hypothetical protein C8R43DRAFT_1022373 [Mycena crocata]|nr:hypothetical protein C8R43DRAFT_1022373 [Mycena crocata]